MLASAPPGDTLLQIGVGYAHRPTLLQMVGEDVDRDGGQYLLGPVSGTTRLPHPATKFVNDGLHRRLKAEPRSGHGFNVDASTLADSLAEYLDYPTPTLGVSIHAEQRLDGLMVDQGLVGPIAERVQQQLDFLRDDLFRFD